MVNDKIVFLIIPARNEAATLPEVLETLPGGIDRVIVADNGSTDSTARIAEKYGAVVVSEPKPGYGRACLAAIAGIREHPPDIVVFADADGSDDLDRICPMASAIAEGEADFVLAARMHAEPGAMSLPQKFGNQLAVALVRLFWKHAYFDLGPMRAISWEALMKLGMSDKNYGWTVEMQIKALQKDLRIKEFSTTYKKRVAGRSKVSRSFPGAVKAGVKIIAVILGEAIKERIQGTS